MGLLFWIVYVHFDECIVFYPLPHSRIFHLRNQRTQRWFVGRTFIFGLNCLCWSFNMGSIRFFFETLSKIETNHREIIVLSISYLQFNGSTRRKICIFINIYWVQIKLALSPKSKPYRRSKIYTPLNDAAIYEHTSNYLTKWNHKISFLLNVLAFNFKPIKILLKKTITLNRKTPDTKCMTQSREWIKNENVHDVWMQTHFNMITIFIIGRLIDTLLCPHNFIFYQYFMCNVSVSVV